MRLSMKTETCMVTKVFLQIQILPNKLDSKSLKMQTWVSQRLKASHHISANARIAIESLDRDHFKYTCLDADKR